MRCLDRDKRWVLVSFYETKVPCVDEQGRLTGKHKVVRSAPVPSLVSVSAAKGAAENSPFGLDLDYDRSIVFEDLTFPIDEAAVLWIDNVDQALCNEAPEAAVALVEADETPHDYTVKRVAASPNCLVVAVKRIEVAR